MCGMQYCIDCVDNKCETCVSGYMEEYGKCIIIITPEERRSEIKLDIQLCHVCWDILGKRLVELTRTLIAKRDDEEEGTKHNQILCELLHAIDYT